MQKVFKDPFIYLVILMNMDKTQKIVVTLLIISVILSIASVVINLSVLSFGSNSQTPTSGKSTSNGATSSGNLGLYVEPSSGGSNG